MGLFYLFFIYLFVYFIPAQIRLCTQNRKFILIVNFIVHLLNVLHMPNLDTIICMHIYKLYT